MNDNKFVEVDAALRELRDNIAQVEGGTEAMDRLEALREELYENLPRWGSVEIARHPLRPCTEDYIKCLSDDFYELHGDRRYEDDPAVVGGLAMIGGRAVVIIGHRKRSAGHKDFMEHRYGMASPSGHHKVIRLLDLAEKFGRPVVTLVDTPGANPVPEAEDRGQAFSIAQCIARIAAVRVPVVACIIGEAGSGGALALGYGDRIIMLENGYYSAISPEGFASIVYRDVARKAEAAEALKGTGHDLFERGLVDYLIDEPVGGAHNDPELVVRETAALIRICLDELAGMSPDELLARRADRIEALNDIRL